MSRAFEVSSPFQPAGDQPAAIKQLVEGVQAGLASQILLGVTGSGKTFTMAHVVEKLQRLQRLMAAIDQVPGEPEGVVTRLETDLVQQGLQLVETALDVADGVYRHGLARISRRAGACRKTGRILPCKHA